MKLILTAALAATVATAAFAGSKSDRYHDNRFDTAIGHLNSFDAAPRSTFEPAQTFKHVTVQPRFSTRSVLQSQRRHEQLRSGTRGKRFIYGGYGRGNDSR